jgi:hypothetical protein
VEVVHCAEEISERTRWVCCFYSPCLLQDAVLVFLSSALQADVYRYPTASGLLAPEKACCVCLLSVGLLFVVLVGILLC